MSLPDYHCLRKYPLGFPFHALYQNRSCSFHLYDARSGERTLFDFHFVFSPVGRSVEFFLEVRGSGRKAPMVLDLAAVEERTTGWEGSFANGDEARLLLEEGWGFSFDFPAKTPPPTASGTLEYRPSGQKGREHHHNVYA